MLLRCKTEQMDIQPSYEYAPLIPANSIRILLLLPASTYSASLRVRLLHTRGPTTLGTYDDTHQTPYEAVSYTWGEPIFSHHLECEGRVIKVTASVNALLRRLCKTAIARPLWIDSVCINQNDLEEKNKQIGMMDKIYNRALKVHVWLGEAEPHDRIEWVFDLFREIASYSRDDEVMLSWHVRAGIPWEKDTEKTVDRFLARPWFRRRWILQEVVLALDFTVRCGRFKMPWRWLALSSSILNAHLPVGEFLTIDSTRSLETIASLSAPSSQLLDLVFDYHLSECFQPSDRIFALYGMATKLKDLSVNYDAPWTDIYHKVSCACIKAGQFLTLLQHVTAFGSLAEESFHTPSWVPRWNNTRLSNKRFSFRNTTSPSQICELNLKTPRIAYSEDTSYHVFRDFRSLEQQNNHEQVAETTQTTSSGRRAASNTTYIDILMLSSWCQKSIEVAEGLTPQCPLAHALSAAIMDMRLCFDTRPIAAEFLGKYTPVMVAFLEKHNFTPADKFYEVSFERLEEKISEAIQDGHQALHDRTEADPLESSIKALLMDVAEILRYHSLFYIRKDTRRGPVYVPGITSCSIDEGDFLLKPLSIADEVQPAATAFLMRPVGKEPIYSLDDREHFKIVGLCFVPEVKILDELKDSTSRWPDSFFIV
ncbi:heterokaryon incompatibility protein-domain-containing protein [Paraphoma chrysanthemicola]|uniref:Heterokaryon incompatibility protein-domain-containing protein n=1 Tax=Paraphoma chrysanthemicola TaxID=798071 RepID=A0A8K0QYC4_9PLEO|nr:heterokaryon incompatibility protein-domain-containing protein [Paraphoma chrysanthemicola]